WRHVCQNGLKVKEPKPGSGSSTQEAEAGASLISRPSWSQHEFQDSQRNPVLKNKAKQNKRKS
ncbi:hypothetical protein ACQP3D_30380, partial [Escherichia coli]